MNTTHELVVLAYEEAFNLPDCEEQPPAAGSDAEFNPWLEAVEQRCELENALAETVVVSDETRLECLAELDAAKKNNYRIYKENSQSESERFVL